MAHNESSAKQPKRRSGAGIVFLILLLLLVGGVGFLYYSVVKAPLELDDPHKMAASTPMSAGERFRFSAADQTAQVKLDAADLWSQILARAGDDFLDTVNDKLSLYDLSVSGCAIRMNEDGLQLNLELYFRDIRLVAKVPCDLEVSGNRFSLTPTGVKLGVINLPVGDLLSGLTLEYEILLPVLSEVTQVSYAQDALLLTGPFGQDIRTLIPPERNLYQFAVLRESMMPIAQTLQTQAGYTQLLQQLERDPGSAEALYRNLFTLASPMDTTAYLDDRYGLTQRFFPGIDFSATAADQAALEEELMPLYHSLEQLFTAVVNDYNEKAFRLSNGTFYLNGRPFQAAQYGAGTYDALFELLNADSFFLVLVDADDGMIRKTSSFNRMADENQQFTQPVDFNRTYILGLVLRGADGSPFLLYESEIQQNNTYSRVIKVVCLQEETVTALQEPGKFGVWTD